MVADTGFVSARTGARRLMGMLLALALLIPACSMPADDVDSTPTTQASAMPVPEIPVATEPPVPPPPTVDPEEVDALPATAAPVAGSTVLVHLEGPVSNRDATDVVVRDEQGTEIDRFRLPGAISVLATPGANQALIYSLPGTWARYDAVSDRLTVVDFSGEPPGSTIAAGSGLAGPTAIWDPMTVAWLLRLDGGPPVDLSNVSPNTSLHTLARSGGVALLDTDEGLVLLEARTGETRPLDAVDAGLSDNGLQLATLVADTDAEGGYRVDVQPVDGSTTTTISPTTSTGRPIPLSADTVLQVGPAPVVLTPSAGPQPFSPSLPLSPPVRVSADEQVALARSGAGLAVVDLAAATVTGIPDTDGWQPLPIGPATVLWAISTNADAPGGLVVDPQTGAVTRFLDGVIIERVLSITANGQRISLRVNDNTLSGAVIVDADGRVMPMVEGSDRSEAVLHPSGSIVAIGSVSGIDRSILLGDVTGPFTRIPTGRSPTWLSTVGPQARPGSQ